MKWIYLILYLLTLSGYICDSYEIQFELAGVGIYFDIFIGYNFEIVEWDLYSYRS